MKKSLLFLFIFFISTVAFAQRGYKQGYYYDKDMNKIEGKIKFIKSSYSSSFGTKPSQIKFRQAGKKTLKLRPEDIKGLVIERDSFAVINNFKINTTGGNLKKDFAKVLESGKINLYIHRSYSYDGKFHDEIATYVLNKEGSNEYYGLYDQRDDRKKILLDLISNNLKLTKELTNASTRKWLIRVRKIVREYNVTEASL